MEDLEQTAAAEQSPIVEQPAEAAPSAPEPPAESAQPQQARSRADAISEALRKTMGDDEPAQDGQPRGPDGKFAAKDAEPAAQKAEPPKEDAQKPAVGDAPARFSPEAKEGWAQTPDPVKSEFRRAIDELESGIRQKDAALQPLKPFMELAQSHGTTVHDALGNYVRMENALRDDLGNGLRLLAENLGITPQELAMAATGGASDQQDQGGQVFAAMRKEIASLKNQLGQVSDTIKSQQGDAIMRHVEEFAQANPRFAELEGQILRLIDTGFAPTLEEAYKAAELLNPVPAPAAPPPTPRPAPQTREALSVTGAPGAGSNPVERRPSATRSEAISRSLDAVGL